MDMVFFTEQIQLSIISKGGTKEILHLGTPTDLQLNYQIFIFSALERIMHPTPHLLLKQKEIPTSQ